MAKISLGDEVSGNGNGNGANGTKDSASKGLISLRDLLDEIDQEDPDMLQGSSVRKVIREKLSKADQDGDGQISAKELLSIVLEDAVLEKRERIERRIIFILVGVVLLLLTGMFGMAIAANELSKETKISSVTSPGARSPIQGLEEVRLTDTTNRPVSTVQEFGTIAGVTRKARRLKNSGKDSGKDSNDDSVKDSGKDSGKGGKSGSDDKKSGSNGKSSSGSGTGALPESLLTEQVNQGDKSISVELVNGFSKGMNIRIGDGALSELNIITNIVEYGKAPNQYLELMLQRDMKGTFIGGTKVKGENAANIGDITDSADGDEMTVDYATFDSAKINYKAGKANWIVPLPDGTTRTVQIQGIVEKERTIEAAWGICATCSSAKIGQVHWTAQCIFDDPSETYIDCEIGFQTQVYDMGNDTAATTEASMRRLFSRRRPEGEDEELDDNGERMDRSLMGKSCT